MYDLQKMLTYSVFVKSSFCPIHDCLFLSGLIIIMVIHFDFANNNV